MAGVCRLGDRAQAHGDAHGCPGCPHTVVGPSITASADVFVDGIPAMTFGDKGMHAACCGPNMWTVIEASAGVFINGKAAVRKGDKTLHCGGENGHMIDASGTVIDNSLAGGKFAAIPQSMLLIDGPGVVAIPPGAAPILDGNGNPVGYAYCGPHDEVGHVYDGNGNVVGDFLVPQHANAQADNSLLNPVDLLVAPLGGIEKEAGKAALSGLADLLKSGARRAVEAIPKSPADAYARAYNYAVEHGPTMRPSDGRPGPVPDAPPPTPAGAAFSVAKTLGSHAFQLWKHKHGLP